MIKNITMESFARNLFVSGLVAIILAMLVAIVGIFFPKDSPLSSVLLFLFVYTFAACFLSLEMHVWNTRKLEKASFRSYDTYSEHDRAELNAALHDTPLSAEEKSQWYEMVRRF